MKNKTIIFLVLLFSTGCTNSKWQIPEQYPVEQEETGVVNLLEITF